MDLLKMRRELENGKSIYDLPLVAVFYARVSTDKDEQLNSLSNQVSYYEDYIKSKKNWIYGGGYVDEGISGTSVNKREDFLRMIEDANEQKFDLILTKEISRFSRSTLDSIRYTQELLDCGVGVFFQNDNINTLFSDAELRLTIMASIAQDEVRRLSERVKFGMKRAYENGRVLGSTNIYGYDKKSGKLSINEKEAEFVRALFSIYAEGKYGYRTIARKLTEMGFTNQSGKALNPGTLRAVIENPKYKGYYCGRITESNNYRQKKSIKLPEEDRVIYKDPSVPAIVSEELWDKANSLLLEKRERFKSKSTRTQSRYKYSGKVLCEEHNTFHYRKLWRDRKIPIESWCCKVYLAKGRKSCGTPHIHTRELDYLHEFIGNNIVKDKAPIVKRLLSRYEQIGSTDSTDYVKEIKRLTNDVDKVIVKKERLLELSIDGSIDKSEFLIMNTRLSSQLETLSSEIEKLKSEQLKSQDKSLMIKNVKSLLDNSINNSELPIELAQNMLDRVVILKNSTQKHIKIRFYMKHGGELDANLLRPGASLEGSAAFILYTATEISPIVGTEKQSEDLITYLTNEIAEDPNKIWELNMFGKSMYDLVKDGLQSKLYRMPEDAQMKLQETLQKIINEGSGGLICIIL